MPLNLAIECGVEWDDGLERIFRAAPDVLVLRDAATGLYPVMLAACVARISLNTVFELVRASPVLVVGGHPK